MVVGATEACKPGLGAEGGELVLHGGELGGLIAGNLEAVAGGHDEVTCNLGLQSIGVPSGEERGEVVVGPQVKAQLPHLVDDGLDGVAGQDVERAAQDFFGAALGHGARDLLVVGAFAVFVHDAVGVPIRLVRGVNGDTHFI